MSFFFGVDVGTSSTKGVLVDERGQVLASGQREHQVTRRSGGIVEMDGRIWWEEFVSLAHELTTEHTPDAVGVSGMGPCVLLTDADGEPVAPSALYGVDMRATEQIDAINAELGAEQIFTTGDAYLSTQSAGPKFRWFAENMPDAYARARRFFMPASFMAWHLTGEYTLDRQSASQSTPLYDAATQQWHDEWWQALVPTIEQPRLGWAGEIAGETREQIAGIAPGTPVIIGSVDAWSEAQSVGAVRPGDLMLMYGTTMFMIATGSSRMRYPGMWGTTGLDAGQYNLAGGMATSGAITAWIKSLTAADSYAQLVSEAEASPAGARGLLMLPYFAGERTPINDPLARGTVVGLTLDHTRGDLYRAALEATGLAVRHNVEVMKEAGVQINRIVAVGGGTTSTLWPSIVTNVTGLSQVVPSITIGASFGAAFLAARTQDPSLDIDEWNSESVTCEPTNTAFYDELYADYRALHEATAEIQHRCARRAD